METISEPLGRVAFGRFQVLPHRRELLAGGQPIRPACCAIRAVLMTR